jgi:hypothetical protein
LKAIFIGDSVRAAAECFKSLGNTTDVASVMAGAALACSVDFGGKSLP